jgi:hypothetical protein
MSDDLIPFENGFTDSDRLSQMQMSEDFYTMGTEGVLPLERPSFALERPSRESEGLLSMSGIRWSEGSMLSIPDMSTINEPPRTIDSNAVHTTPSGRAERMSEDSTGPSFDPIELVKVTSKEMREFQYSNPPVANQLDMLSRVSEEGSLEKSLGSMDS